jgi:hypothetical protein
MGLAAAAASLALAGCSTVDPAPEKQQPTGVFPAPRLIPAATLWAVGDGDGSVASSRLAALIKSARPGAFLYLGDVYEAGTAADFRRAYAPTFGRLRSRTLPTPGNHEWGNRAEGYNRYWAGVTKGEPPAYYAVRLGRWQLVSVNSEQTLDPKGSQVQWLTRQVAGPGTCRLVFWHRPRFSAGLHGDQSDVAPLWLAVVGRAALVVNGHDHDMQRFAPVRGTTEVISGAGGHGRYPVDPADTRVVWSNDRAYGGLRIRLFRRHERLAFVAASGRVLHRFGVRCSPGG